MATTKTTTKEVKSKKSEAKSGLIVAPRVTEKASTQSSANIYTFVVKQNATKHDLSEEIKKEYKVTPRAINIVNLPRRKVFIRGKFGFQPRIKKAIVFLKKGDSINIK